MEQKLTQEQDGEIEQPRISEERRGSFENEKACLPGLPRIGKGRRRAGEERKKATDFFATCEI
jgi:hypothetical protein